MPAVLEHSVSDVVERPLDFLSRLFERAGQPVRDKGNDWGVQDYFKGILLDPDSREKIPVLKPEVQLPNQSLCRFQGLVQDQMNPEFYIGAYKQPDSTWKTTKYCDSAVVPQEALVDDHYFWERRQLYCTAVPGEAAWCKPRSISTLTSNLEAGHNTKRAREEFQDEVMAEATEEGQAAKRHETTAPTSGNDARRHATEAGDCIVLDYHLKDSVKVNDVMEFIGIYSADPMWGQQNLQPGSLADEVHQATHPPTSLVPRIHALAAVMVKGTEELPIISFKSSKERQEQVAELREASLAFLKNALGGDELAAEYVLLQLVSRVQGRRESTVLGALSLGITDCPPDATGNSDELSPLGQTFRAALQALVPKAVGLPCTIGKLNARGWCPARDADGERLITAALQLSPNTHLILDETRLQEGQLTEVGLKNLKALKDLLETQRVEYDFSVYTLPMPADIPVTILSNYKSLLHKSLDVMIPLQMSKPPAGTMEQIALASQAEGFNCVRAYLGLVRFLDFSISPAQAEFVEKELVQKRSLDRSFGERSMHLWLTLCNLVGRSYGEEELSERCWKRVKALEDLRAKRIK